MPKQKINQLCKCQTIIVSIICRSTHTDFGMLHNPLWPIEGSTRQKLNRDVLELTDVLNKMALTSIYIHKRIYLLSAPRGNFSNIYIILRQKASFDLVYNINV